MDKGIDTATPITAAVAAQFAAEGHRFVGRYLVPPGYSKRLTAAEARVLTDAGLLILSVYETTANRAAGGAANGQADGAKALAAAREIGMPEGAYIYLAVDYGAPASDYDAIEAYLRAARAQIGGYGLGVYGSYYVIEAMRARGVCDGYWQCIGWSGGKVADGLNAYQYDWDKRLAGVGVDYNYLYDAAGLWNLEEDNMTGEEIVKRANEYLAEQPCPDWAKAELQEAIDAGITDGERPMQLVPRYQAAIMAKRAVEAAKK